MYYTILNLEVDETWCLDCDLARYPENMRDTIRDYNHKMDNNPKCHHYYASLIHEAADHRNLEKASRYLVLESDLTRLFKLCAYDKGCSRYDVLALVSAEVVHSSSRDKDVWHAPADLLTIHQTWNFDADLVSHYCQVCGAESFHANYAMFVTMAIRGKCFRLYQYLTTLDIECLACSRDDRISRTGYTQQDLEQLFMVATDQDRLWILQQPGRLDLNSILNYLEMIDWNQKSQADINAVVDNILCYNSVKWQYLTELRQIGLTFNHENFDCGNPENFFYAETTMIYESDLSQLSHNTLQPELVSYFKTWNFPTEFFQMLYLKACLRGDLSIVQKLLLESEISDRIRNYGFVLVTKQMIGCWPLSNAKYRDLQQYLVVAESLPIADEAIMPTLEMLALETNWQNHDVLSTLQHITWSAEVLHHFACHKTRAEAIQVLVDTGTVSASVNPETLLDAVRSQSDPESVLQLVAKANIQLSQLLVLNLEEHYYNRYLKLTVTWAEYLIFVLECDVSRVQDLAQTQGEGLDMVEFINRILTPDHHDNSREICNQHDVCFYNSIMNQHFRRVCRNFIHYGWLYPEIQARIRPYL